MKYLLSITLLLISGIYFTYSYAKNDLYEVREIKDSIRIEIPNGTSITAIVKEFNKRGFLTPAWAYRKGIQYYSDYSKQTVLAGNYLFVDTLSNHQIIQTLFSGGLEQVKSVILHEGSNIEEFASQLSKHGGIDSARFVELCTSDSLLKARNIPSNSVLGYLMPDTYEFYIHESPEKVISRLLDAAENFWNTRNMDFLSKQGLTRHEAITLASIVEAETPLKSEASTVSGLYLNRLKKGILLQADPTVQFAMGEKRRVLYRDLERDHPYNTYVYPGLPPGPINNPGKTALKAAIKPKDHAYIFMVAMGDGSGRHYFSKTLREHNNYIKQYRKTKDSLKKINSLSVNSN